MSFLQEVVPTSEEDKYSTCVRLLSGLCSSDCGVVCVDSEENGLRLVQVGSDVLSLTPPPGLVVMPIAAVSPLSGGQDVEWPAFHLRWMERFVAPSVRHCSHELVLFV